MYQTRQIFRAKFNTIINTNRFFDIAKLRNDVKKIYFFVSTSLNPAIHAESICTHSIFHVYS